jgi:hypothetical protein
VSFKLPNLSTLIASFGGAAGIAGAICTLLGVTPASPVGKIAQAVVSGGLLLIAHWHGSSVVAEKVKTTNFEALEAKKTATV